MLFDYLIVLITLKLTEIGHLEVRRKIENGIFDNVPTRDVKNSIFNFSSNFEMPYLREF